MGVVAAALAVQGKKDIEKIKGLLQTQETLQEIPRDPEPREGDAMTTSNNLDEIRADIERTRRESARTWTPSPRR